MAGINPATGMWDENYEPSLEAEAAAVAASKAPATSGALPAGATVYGTANSGPRPDGKPGLTPTTPVGGYQAKTQSAFAKDRVDVSSGRLGNTLGAMGDAAGAKGNVALEEFYGVTKPTDNTASAAQYFADENAIDPSTARNPEVDRAFQMSSDLVDRILNAPSQAKLVGDQALSQQLALGRSSPGGIGNVQAGVKSAMGAAPQLQAQTQQAVLQEQQTRAAAATGAANIYAGVAQGTADRETRIAESNQNAANNVLTTMTQKYGMDLNFSTEQRAQLGQLSRDFFNNQAQFAQMDVQQQIAAWDNITKIYGIDATLKAAMEQIAAQENIGPLDAFKLVLGGIDAVGSLIPKPGP
jgi:hypothetical protein